MLIEKKEKFTLISSDENSAKEFYKLFLNEEQKLLKEHVVLKISNIKDISTEDFSVFLTISERKKKNKTSFIILNSEIDIDDVPEEINIVPTLQEAEDVIEMEAMERELGF